MKKILLILSIIGFYNHSVLAQTDSFEGSIEYNYFRSGQIFWQEKHIFSDNAYEKTLLSTNAMLNLGDLLILFSTKERLSISHKERTMKRLGAEPKTSSARPDKIIETEEFREIQGYRCRKYIIEKYNTEYGRTTLGWHWIAGDLEFENLDKIASITADLSSVSSVRELSKGLPLRIDLLDESGDVKSYYEATKITTEVIITDPSELRKKGYRFIK
ncbi:hypothetical protein [uncultured Roseivirga sp.]|uniref:hypothetical protein n=1 Tax=uncultured Roseivirga sp. TaxID=543088 RepID=UPI0030DBC230|tara:strand:+ start:193362 stop:194009 length:648 start_codon:yes stop_codon:yes gene_type:complete